MCVPSAHVHRACIVLGWSPWLPPRPRAEAQSQGSSVWGGVGGLDQQLLRAWFQRTHLYLDTCSEAPPGGCQGLEKGEGGESRASLSQDQVTGLRGARKVTLLSLGAAGDRWQGSPGQETPGL